MTYWQMFWTMLAFILITIETNLSRNETGWGYWKWIWLWVVAVYIIWLGVAS